MKQKKQYINLKGYYIPESSKYNHKLKPKKPRYSKLKNKQVDFYSLQRWKSLRFEVLRDQGAECALCGALPGKGVVMHIDHIKPRSIYPELQWSKNNLQVLCSDCNEGKLNRDETDFRK